MKKHTQRAKSIDNTPNRLRSDVNADLDGIGGDNDPKNVSGAESDEHNPMPTLPQQPDVAICCTKRNHWSLEHGG